RGRRGRLDRAKVERSRAGNRVARPVRAPVERVNNRSPLSAGPHDARRNDAEPAQLDVVRTRLCPPLRCHAARRRDRCEYRGEKNEETHEQRRSGMNAGMEYAFPPDGGPAARVARRQIPDASRITDGTLLEPRGTR